MVRESPYSDGKTYMDKSTETSINLKHIYANRLWFYMTYIPTNHDGSQAGHGAISFIVYPNRGRTRLFFFQWEAIHVHCCDEPVVTIRCRCGSIRCELYMSWQTTTTIRSQMKFCFIPLQEFHRTIVWTIV
jgi:hypothetical protein